MKYHHFHPPRARKMQQGSSAKRPPELKICVELTANVCRTIPQIVLGWPAGFQGYSDGCPGCRCPKYSQCVASAMCVCWCQSVFMCHCLMVALSVALAIWFMEHVAAPRPMNYWDFHPPRASFWPTSNEISTSPSSQSFFLLYFVLPHVNKISTIKISTFPSSQSSFLFHV